MSDGITGDENLAVSEQHRQASREHVARVSGRDKRSIGGTPFIVPLTRLSSALSISAAVKRNGAPGSSTRDTFATASDVRNNASKPAAWRPPLALPRLRPTARDRSRASRQSDRTRACSGASDCTRPSTWWSDESRVASSRSSLPLEAYFPARRAPVQLRKLRMSPMSSDAPNRSRFRMAGRWHQEPCRVWAMHRDAFAGLPTGFLLAR